MSEFKIDRAAADACYEMARKSFVEGGVPVGAVLAKDGEIIATGHNQRVQKGDPIAHGEMDCLRNAGRRATYDGLTLYTSLSPCMMCSGTIVQFGIPNVVILDDQNFGGNEEFLRSHGVNVLIHTDDRCVRQMKRFIEEKPKLWNEDIAE